MAEIASAFVTLAPSARGFGRKTESQLTPEVDGAGRKLGRGFGKAFAVAGAAIAAAGIGKFLVSSISAASDLGEELSKSGVIFGRQAGKIKKFAETASTALGQSEVAALNATSTFGQIAQKAGLGGEATARFAQVFTRLASDMASFSNTTPEEAIEAIGSAMRGEAEPIRKYGVLLDDATLRATALKFGIIDTIKEALTPQQKALAASHAILEQTGKAQGDFARTSGGLANQQRILTAQFDNFKTKLGAAFLPVALKVVRFFNDKMIPALEKFSGFIRDKVVPRVTEFAGKVRDKLEPVLRKAGGYIKETLIPYLKDFAGDVRDRVVPVVNTLREKFEDLKPRIQDFIGALRDGIPTAVEKIRNARQALLDLRDSIVSALKPVVDGLVRDFKEDVKPAFDDLKNAIKNDLKPALDDLAEAFKDPAVRDLIKQLAKLAFAFIYVNIVIVAKVLPVLARFSLIYQTSFVQTLALGLRAMTRGVEGLGNMRRAFGLLLDSIQRFRNNAAVALNGFLEAVQNLPGKVRAALGAIVTNAKQAGAELINKMVEGVTGRASYLTTQAVLAVQRALSAARNAITGGIPGIGGGAGKGAGRLAAPGFTGSLPSFFDAGAFTPIPRTTVLRVGEREFVGFMDERADDRVSSAHDLNSESRRATWQR